MADYDVKADLSIDSVKGVEGVKLLASSLLALQKDITGMGASVTSALKSNIGSLSALKQDIAVVGSSVTTALRGVKPAAVDFSSAIQQTTRSMDQLDKSAQRTARATRETAQHGRQAATNIGSALRSALGFAAAYIGVRTVVGGMRALVSSSFAYGTTMERNRIALASVLATQSQFAGQENPMVAAMRVGDQVFGQLEDDAIESVASSQDLISIYSQIAGPLSGAGASLTKIREITNDSVSAAAALGVDFAQAARDVNLMATGVAGQDTALFRMLRATGAIKMNTEEWNKMMQETPTKGVAALSAALGQFKASAAVYAASLPGLVSSMGDFMKRFRGAFMSGPLAILQGTLTRLVATFKDNQREIKAVLTTMGEAFGRVLDPALRALERMTTYLIEHWTDIAARIEKASVFAGNLKSGVQHYAPALQVAGAGMLAAKFAPGAVSAAAGAMGGGKVAAAGGTALEIGKDAFLAIRAFGGLGTALATVGLVVGVVVGAIGFMVDAWKPLTLVFGVLFAVFQQVAVTVWGLIESIGGALFPVFKAIAAVAGIFAVVVGGFFFMLGRMIWSFVKVGIEGWTKFFDIIGKGFDWVYQKVLGVFNSLASFFGVMNEDILPKGGADTGGGWLSDFLDKARTLMIPDDMNYSSPEGGTPSARTTTVNDFRGSRIEVKQDFRDADPDRVWLQMVDGLNGAADRRIASALVPDYTR